MLSIPNLIAFTICAIIILETIRIYDKLSRASKQVLETYRHTYESYPTSLSVFGVLGTFIGITYGLISFNPEDIESSVPKLLGGMKIAFITSITGMICSWIIGKVVNYKYDSTKETDITTAVNKLSQTITDLKSTVKKNNEDTLRAAINSITSTFQEEMGKISNNINELFKKFVDKNFEELNKSINNLNTWQQDNKNMIDELTKKYKEVVKEHKSASTVLDNMASSTEKLISEDGKLTELILKLDEAMSKDENFINISKNLTSSATSIINASEDWKDAVVNLNEWVNKQYNIAQCIQTLISQLNELNKQRDYNEEFWKTTKKGMDDATQIIGCATVKLNKDLRNLDDHFYERLNATLTNLDRCIQKFMQR